ncbi:acyl-ACP--UDP-N-acetylglucosamine O-acyltransferase [candidate division KSB1 bacterium]|nr:MAG: acyl-ACP--UDP-N-acetylglucosamine O-acyltransferase [candidate division KSB1 bacterium]RPH95334.1 MAG: acyl-ACP--UDP-N-acetylglucosamine O-acyltransferase [candidate division KSB1 bacterium]
MTYIHSSAVVSPHAKIADNVEIGPGSVIDKNVIIGDGCRIDSCVHLYSGVRLGRGVRVFHGAALGGEPQDLKFGGEETELFVGDNTILREFVTLSRGTKATGRTIVGSDCMLMAYSHVAHDCSVGNQVILANSVALAGHVEIEDFAILGGIVPVHQFVRIGRYAFVGGGVRVPKDIPPYIMATGQPTSYYGLNSVGLRRRGFSDETRLTLKRVYSLLFQSKLNISQAVATIQAEYGHIEEVRIILEFISKSKRGLIPGNKRLRSEDEA